MAMKTNRFIAILVLFSFFLGANAKKKEKDYPLSEIKVGYTYHYKFLRGSDGIVEKDVPLFCLPIGIKANSIARARSIKIHCYQRHRVEPKNESSLIQQRLLTLTNETGALWMEWFITLDYM